MRPLVVVPWPRRLACSSRFRTEAVQGTQQPPECAKSVRPGSLGGAGQSDSLTGLTERRMTQFRRPFGRTYSKPTRSYKPRVPLYRKEEDIFLSLISCG